MGTHTTVEPSLYPLEAVLTNGRHRRLARKWPWSWRCRSCPDAYGAARTEREALGAADQHETAQHAKQSEMERCPSCDHEKKFHAPDDGRCWFTVDHGVTGSNLVCPCAPLREEAA
jgi:hypothetical protein